MGSERQYAAVEVVGRAGGLNQSGWEGAIADNECTALWNMGITVDGEWSKRKGYTHLADTSAALTTPPTLTLHWHTNEEDDAATGAGWVQDSTEVTAASSGALTFSPSAAMYTGGPVTLDGESVLYLESGSTRSLNSWFRMASSFNYDADAGRLRFFFRIVQLLTGTPIYSTATLPPAGNVYLFYASANFNMYFSADGHLIWRYGAGAAEILDAGPVDTESWHTVDIKWDNTVGGAKHRQRFIFSVDGIDRAYADAGQVTLTFDTYVYWYNTGSSGQDAPVGPYNWPNMAIAMNFQIAAISSWSYSSASDAGAPQVTGIHNNSSQQRAIVTVGDGGIYYSPNYGTIATGSPAVAATRTSATECQGNIYITDGTTTMHYFVGAATAVSKYTLPETAKWIEEYHGHLCIAGLGTNGAHSVRLSTIDDFTTSSAVSWPATNQVFKCRDTVRGIKAYGGQLIVGTRTTIEAISGYQPHDFAKTLVANAGCASHWSMKEVPLSDGSASALIWAGYDGIYMLIQGQVSKISWAVQDFWDTLSKTRIEESHAVDCRDRGEYMLAVSDGSGNYNTHVIVYNYRAGGWAIWKYAHRIDVLGKFYQNGKETILGGDIDGNVYGVNRGDNDNEASIDGYLLTKWHDGGVPDQEKDFRKLYVWASPSANYSVDIGHSVDYSESVIPASVVVGTDGSDYTCISSHEPSVVVGSDDNDYYCTDAHTAGASTKPITGADYATVWVATGSTGRGETWLSGEEYISNDDRKPITGGQYTSYWVAKNTVGEGEVWAAGTGYASESVGMDALDSISLDVAGPVFGTAVFGTATFAAGVSTRVFAIDTNSSRGRSIRFMFRNKNADEPFTIRGYKAWFTYIQEFPA